MKNNNNIKTQIKQQEKKLKIEEAKLSETFNKIEFTAEEKKHLEQETSFIMYLSKTKQGKFIGKEFFVGKTEPLTKLTELDPEARELFYKAYEDEQLLVLEVIVKGQMLIEAIDQMDANYYGNMTPVKTAIQVLKKKLTGPVERDFAIVHRNGGKTEDGVNAANGIIQDLEAMCHDIATFRVPAKIVQSKMNRAFNYENDTMLATADRIIRKHEK